MDFSDLYKQTQSRSCLWSPNGTFLATPVQMRLVIRLCDTLEIVQYFVCADDIEAILWDESSRFILCELRARGMVQVWSIEDSSWSCILNEGSFGLSRAIWANNSNHIVTFDKDYLHGTIWNIHEKDTRLIPFPKRSTAEHPIYSLHSDGSIFAIVARKSSQDLILFLDTTSWDILAQFYSECQNVQQICWSPKDRILAVLDDTVENKVVIFDENGVAISTIVPYTGALGSRCLSFSPSGQFLSIGAYDQKVRLYNTLTWGLFKDWQHSREAFSKKTKVYKEENAIRFSSKKSPQTSMPCFAIVDESYEPPQLTINPKLPDQKHGVSALSWSCDGHFLLSMNENMPNTLWIWDVADQNLASSITFGLPVKSYSWSPKYPRLAVCTGNPILYLWTPETASCVRIPFDDFSTSNISWHPNGYSMLIAERERFCVCEDSKEDEGSSYNEFQAQTAR